MKVITPAATKVITLNELKAQARIELSYTSDDALLTNKIAAAQEWIEDYLQIYLLSTIIEQRYHQLTNWMHLPSGPVADTGYTVKYYDAANVEQTLGTELYEVVTDAFPPYIHIPTVPAQAGLRVSGASIRYTVGYGATADKVPAPLREAVLILAATLEYQRTISTDWALSVVGHLIHNYKNEYALV